MIYGDEGKKGGELPLENGHEGCRLCQHNGPCFCSCCNPFSSVIVQ
jgi:hypothetical protein